jgi:hypothetical protein
MCTDLLIQNAGNVRRLNILFFPILAAQITKTKTKTKKLSCTQNHQAGQGRNEFRYRWKTNDEERNAGTMAI